MSTIALNVDYLGNP